MNCDGVEQGLGWLAGWTREGTVVLCRKPKGESVKRGLLSACGQHYRQEWCY